MIRKAIPQDFDFIFQFYMHPLVNPFLLYEVMDKEIFKPVFEALLAKEILYIFFEENKEIGMFKLMPLAYRNSHIAYLGGLAIHPDYSGKGFGLIMMNEILALAKQDDFLRIELSVASENVKAIRLYEKAGFEKEGLFKKFSYLKSENRYLDEVAMAWLSVI